MQYLATEVLDQAFKIAKSAKKRRINPKIIKKVFETDSDFGKLVDLKKFAISETDNFSEFNLFNKAKPNQNL